MRVTNYKKRRLSKKGYIFANAEIQNDEYDIISNENVYADGFNLVIDGHCSNDKEREDWAKHIEIRSDFESMEQRDEFKTACEKLLEGTYSTEWKIAIVRITPICITLYVVNRHLYEKCQNSNEVDFDGVIEIGTTALTGANLTFLAPLGNTVMRYDIYIEYGSVKVTEYEEDKKRELVFTSKEKKTGGGQKGYIQETEWLY